MNVIDGKAIEIILDQYSEFQGLLLLLLDLGNHDMSLQSLCLTFLSNNKQYYSLATLENFPQHLQKRLDVIEDETLLAQQGVGKWAGDRLSLTGDETHFSRYPPHGEWKEGSIYEMVREEFSCILAPKISFHYFDKLQKLCTDKDYKVVNLDKKVFLNPLAYEPEESEKETILDYAESHIMLKVNMAS